MSTNSETDRPTTLADAAARDRILTDLDTNLLVEAGAGSGKTTSLVGRILALIERGEPIEHIAAVTFTRKAATELRERIQLRLERTVATTDSADPRAPHFRRALHDLDRAFLGTIHAFCARILREHAIDIALDPGFQEVTEDDWNELTRRFWSRWLDRARRTDDPALRQLADVGIDPRSLLTGFMSLVEYGDVDFSVTQTTLPDAAPCRKELDALLDRAKTMMPPDEPEGGWDSLMCLVRRLEHCRKMRDWSSATMLCVDLERIRENHCGVTQNRWSTSREGKAAAKALSEEFKALLRHRIADVLRCWREHRYPILIKFLRDATAAFERERHVTGQLGFGDLLSLSAKLLREHSAVRASLGIRYPRLLVDEFQDTDPIQAEVCFLLASDPSQGTDWRRATPRPGSLFFVGDPKQSIYRFRRADIQVYELAKSRIATCGAVLALTQNFRSVHPIATVVNEHFGAAFPITASDVQAAFSPMQTVRAADTPTQGVFRYAVRPERDNKPTIVATDAAQVASWIDHEIQCGTRAPGDFLVLTVVKAHIGVYARALAERNVPVSTTGARLPQERELQELLVVLQALADPENPMLVVAALEGMFFGCSPADLYDAKYAGLRFIISQTPVVTTDIVGRAMEQLHQWWLFSKLHPADVVVERIFDDTGVVAYAASQTLGDARAGALLHLLESLRIASVSGLSSLTDAVERIRVLLTHDIDDAPLRPGRTDAVRVMNLHKAKGLEAPVVVLAAPVDWDPPDPLVHVIRGDDTKERTTARGGIAIVDDKTVLAHPSGWDEMMNRESRFAEAERSRLLYVAATRAKDALVVAQCERTTKSGVKPDQSAWSPLAGTLERHATVLHIEPSIAPGPRVATVSMDAIVSRIADANARVARATTPSFEMHAVTAMAHGQFDGKSDDAEHPSRSDDIVNDMHEVVAPRFRDAKPAGYGIAWGTAVHRCLEAMGRGRTGASLHAFVRAVAAQCGLDERATVRLDALLERVCASAVWQRWQQAELRHVELPMMARVLTKDLEVITEGVIDAVALADGQWWITDWKTDHVDDTEWIAREARYHAQIEGYATLLTQLSGHPARSAIERLS